MDPYVFLLLAIGVMVGAINSATGIGWGIINVPILLSLPFLNTKQAISLSVLAALFVNAMASFENLRRGYIVWQYLIWIAAGGILGGYIGAYLLSIVSPHIIKKTVAILCIGVGIKLLFDR